MHRFRKAGMSIAAVALATSGIVALFAMPASAKSNAPKGKITCTAMSGSGSTITISGCSGTAVPGTGGAQSRSPSRCWPLVGPSLGSTAR